MAAVADNAASRALTTLALLGMGKINYLSGYGRDPNKRYVVARLALTVAEVGMGKDAEIASFEVDQFAPEDANNKGLTLVSQRMGKTCTMPWDELRVLRELDIKPDEMCVAMFLKDGMVHATFKRSALAEPC
jgi:hypothetical protein